MKCPGVSLQSWRTWVPFLSETLIQLIAQVANGLELGYGIRGPRYRLLWDEIENATRTISVRRSPAAARKRSITSWLWAVDRLNVATSPEKEERTPLRQISGGATQ